MNFNNGTAIGNAIWLTTNSLDKVVPGGTLVVIGDGDNTAGYINPKPAAEIARVARLKIYSIGVGKKGLVPFGTDQFGNKHMVDNTFDDGNLKFIATVTGGKYFHALNEDAIVESLKSIFP